MNAYTAKVGDNACVDYLGLRMAVPLPSASGRGRLREAAYLVITQHTTHRNRQNFIRSFLLPGGKSADVVGIARSQGTHRTHRSRALA